MSNETHEEERMLMHLSFSDLSDTELDDLLTIAQGRAERGALIVGRRMGQSTSALFLDANRDTAPIIAFAREHGIDGSRIKLDLVLPYSSEPLDVMVAPSVAALIRELGIEKIVVGSGGA